MRFPSSGDSMGLLLRVMFALVCLVLYVIPALAVTVTPSSATVKENATQQFTASTPSTWTTSCGSVSSAGLFKAPLYPTTTCKVTATATNGSGSAAAAVTVVSAIVMTPVSAKTPQGQTQQFTANMPVSWIAKCGTITAGGLFTATGTVGTSCTIEAIATTAPKYTAYGYDTITAPTASGSGPITISPASATVTEAATQQFTASTAATWITTCGSVSTSGLFKAPLYPSTTCKVTATNSTGSASAAITVVSAIVMNPVSAKTPQGNTQQFTANMPVAWTAKCGTISASGLYSATGPVGTNCTIEAIATGTTKYTAYGYDSITVPSAVALNITPLSPSLPAGTTQQFTSSTPATWAATCGTITAAGGLYTAPAGPGSCTITATATDGSGHVTSTVVTITAALAISPAAITTPQGQTQQFSANYPVVWSADCGSITSAGLFTASGVPGSVCTITGTAISGPANSATARDTIGAAAQFGLSPLTPTLAENATQQFTATAPATFAATCGTVDAASGMYTATLVPGTCQVTATSSDGSNSAVSTNVTVTSPISLSPSVLSLHALNTKTFTASQPVSWSASCGSISDAGIYTAPATESDCTITATATGTPAYTAQATVEIDLVNQTRWRNNQGGTGLQPNELALTPANVNAASFGQVWSAAVDGGVWAEPLYMNALTVNGAPHNVVFVATDNDSVYALDADTGAQLWQTSLVPSGATAVAGTMVDDPFIPSIGVLGTPVIDNGTLYVVGETAEQNATYFPHRLHALDLTTGAEKFGGPVLISDANLQPAHKLQRPGLTVANGTVYVALGSLGDKQPYHGLLFAFDENTLAQTGLWNATPTGNSGGLWQAGGAPSVDSDGNLYVITGNGYSDGVTNFGESAVKLSPSLQLQDFFSPFNAATLTASDLDLGSASVPVMPDQNGPYPHVLIFCGKSPDLYVVNRDSMGQKGSTSNNVIQEL